MRWCTRKLAALRSDAWQFYGSRQTWYVIVAFFLGVAALLTGGGWIGAVLISRYGGETHRFCYAPRRPAAFTEVLHPDDPRISYRVKRGLDWRGPHCRTDDADGAVEHVWLNSDSSIHITSRHILNIDAEGRITPRHTLRWVDSHKRLMPIHTDILVGLAGITAGGFIALSAGSHRQRAGQDEAE